MQKTGFNKHLVSFVFDGLIETNLHAKQRMYHSKRVAAVSNAGRKNFLSPTKASLSRKKNCRIVDRRSKKPGHKSVEKEPRIIEIYNDETKAPSAPQANGIPSLLQAPKTRKGVKVSSPSRQTLKPKTAGNLGDTSVLRSSNTKNAKVIISNTNPQKENAINDTQIRTKRAANVDIPKVQSKNSALKDREQKK